MGVVSDGKMRKRRRQKKPVRKLKKKKREKQMMEAIFGRCHQGALFGQDAGCRAGR